MKKNKVILIISLVIILVLALFFGLRKNTENTKRDDTPRVYEAMVTLRSQESADPEDDRKNSLKRGDVVSIRADGHEWSDTEWNSYLLIKLKIKPSQSETLVSPMVKRALFKKDETGRKEEELLVARQYYIDMEAINFPREHTFGQQPLKDEVFDWGVVREKKFEN